MTPLDLATGSLKGRPAWTVAGIVTFIGKAATVVFVAGQAGAGVSRGTRLGKPTFAAASPRLQ